MNKFSKLIYYTCILEALTILDKTYLLFKIHIALLRFSIALQFAGVEFDKQKLHFSFPSYIQFYKAYILS